MKTDRQIDGVWAVEPGVTVSFERLENGRVSVTIWQEYGEKNQHVAATATMEPFRWERIVEAMRPKVEPEDIVRAIESER